jgi:hypothetical protein
VVQNRNIGAYGGFCGFEPGAPGNIELARQIIVLLDGPRADLFGGQAIVSLNERQYRCHGDNGATSFYAVSSNPSCVFRRGNPIGNSFHSLPSSKRPPDFGERPPHCLKKNATFVLRHWLRTSMTQCLCIGRARGPLSPPTITQSMPARSSLPTGPISGSTERNRVAALAFYK